MLLFSTRLACFPSADRVVVLADGRIEESGSHETLLSTGGLYARIFRAQRHAGQPRTAAAMAGTVPERGR